MRASSDPDTSTTPPSSGAPKSSWLATWRRSAAFHRRPLLTLIDAERAAGPAFSLTTVVAGRAWVVCTPELAYEVLHAAPGMYLAGRANRRILPVLPNGTVLTLDGDEHRARRRVLAPLFHGDSLKAIAPIIRDTAAVEIDRWPVGVPLPFCRERASWRYASRRVCSCPSRGRPSSDSWSATSPTPYALTRCWPESTGCGVSVR